MSPRRPRASADLRTLLELEERRSMRTGRGFTIVRIAQGSRASDDDLTFLRAIVEHELRSTDSVQIVGSEVGALLSETAAHQAQAPLSRLRALFARGALAGEPRIGWACVGPGQRFKWQEAWRWAGALLVADAKKPAAA